MKIITGVVVSKNMQKTATVAVTRILTHPIYKKRFKRTKKYHVHDILNVRIGDKVEFVASKPYSKTKKWKVLKVIGNKTENISDEGRKKITRKQSVKSNKKSV